MAKKKKTGRPRKVKHIPWTKVDKMLENRKPATLIAHALGISYATLERRYKDDKRGWAKEEILDEEGNYLRTDLVEVYKTFAEYIEQKRQIGSYGALDDLIKEGRNGSVAALIFRVKNELPEVYAEKTKNEHEHKGSANILFSSWVQENNLVKIQKKPEDEE